MNKRTWRGRSRRLGDGERRAAQQAERQHCNRNSVRVNVSQSVTVVLVWCVCVCVYM